MLELDEVKSTIILNPNTNPDNVGKIQEALDYLSIGDLNDYAIVYDETLPNNRAVIITESRVAHTLEFEVTE